MKNIKNPKKIKKNQKIGVWGVQKSKKIEFLGGMYGIPSGSRGVRRGTFRGFGGSGGVVLGVSGGRKPNFWPILGFWGFYPYTPPKPPKTPQTAQNPQKMVISDPQKQGVTVKTR